MPEKEADKRLENNHTPDMTKEIPVWADALCATIRTDDQYREWPPIEVVFVGSTFRFGIEIFSGTITLGDRGTCYIRADDAVLESVACGKATLQSVHNAGKAQLSGDPSHLLRLAVVFDQAGSA